MKAETTRSLNKFFIIWGGQAFSLLGSQLVQFALIWYLTQQTGSATVLAIASFVGLLPPTLFGPLAGTLVDRWPRRWVMVGADTLVMGATLLLLGLFASGRVEIWHIYLILFIRALGGAFHVPAMQASTSLMVPAQHLTRIAGLNQMLNGGLNILAAPLGAVLVQSLTMPQILLIDALTALLAIGPLLVLRVPQPPAGDSPKTGSVMNEMKAGFRYVWQWPGLRMLIAIALVLNFIFTPAFSLLPLLVTTHFKGDALQLGSLNAAFGAGVLLGGLLLGVWGGFQRRIMTSLMGLLILGISVLLFSFVPAGFFPLAVGCLFIFGIGQPVTNGPIFAILQAVVAPDMQGRVFTVLGSLAGGMAPIGLLLIGPLADLFGVRVWYAIAGVVCISLTTIGFFNPHLTNLENNHTPPPNSQQKIAPSPS